MTRLPLVIIAVLALGVEAHGQAGPASTSIAPVLSRALTPSRLARVLGKRAFTDKRGGRVTVTCSLDDPKTPTALTCVASFVAVGAMREESLTLRCTLGLDGRVQASGFELVRGRDRTKASGQVGGGELKLSVRESRGEHSQTRQVNLPWSDDVVPYTLTAFVLPLLGLPNDLTLRVFHPVSLAVNAKPSTLRHGKGSLTVTQAYPGVDMVVRFGRSGAIREVVLGEHEAYTAVEEKASAR